MKKLFIPHCFSATANQSTPLRNQRLLIGVLSAMASISGLAGAQDMPAVSNDPTKAQQATPDSLPKQPPGDGKGFSLPRQPVPAEQGPNGKSVQLKRVDFEGNTVFDTEELSGVVESYLNRPIMATDIEELRLKVTRYYVDHGYINSGAALMSQSLADGVLHLRIIEGRLTEVRQDGQERLQDYYIRDRLIAGAGEPLNVRDLQDSYRGLLSDPLIAQMNGKLLPGVHPGESVLDVKVVRNRPYQFYAGADDYQTPSVGGYTGRMGGWVDNLLTLGERIDAQFIVNGGALGYNTGISIPVSAYDTRVSFRYSDTSSTLVEAPFNSLNVATHIQGFDGGVSQPVYRTDTDNVVLGLNFAVRESRTLQSNSCAGGAFFTGITGDASCDSQVTVLRMSQRLTHRGETNGAVFYSTFNAGLNALGATSKQLGGQSGQFFSWLGQSMFNQRLMENGTLLVLKGNIQLADSALLPLERFALGGVYTVRGYRENTYIRDNGFNTNLEIKYPIYGGDGNQKSNLYLVPFVDYGKGWNNTTVAAPSVSNSLFSSGIGFTWQYRQVSTEFYWAHAFTAVVPKPTSHAIQDDGIHFRVNINAF